MHPCYNKTAITGRPEAMMIQIQIQHRHHHRPHYHHYHHRHHRRHHHHHYHKNTTIISVIIIASRPKLHLTRLKLGNRCQICANMFTQGTPGTPEEAKHSTKLATKTQN